MGQLIMQARLPKMNITVHRLATEPVCPQADEPGHTIDCQLMNLPARSQLSTCLAAGLSARQPLYPFLPIPHLPSHLTIFKQARVPGLGMAKLAEILHRRVQRPVLHPGLCRALTTQAFKETPGAAVQVIGVFGLRLSRLREKECPHFPGPDTLIAKHSTLPPAPFQSSFFAGNLRHHQYS